MAGHQGEGRHAHAAQALRYAVAGAVAAAAHYGARFAFERAMPFEAAVLLASGVGIGVAFVLMRRWVFPPARRGLGFQIGGFLVVSALSAAQTLLVSSLMLRWVLPALGLEAGLRLAGLPLSAAAIAHAVGIVVPALVSYRLHGAWSFR